MSTNQNSFVVPEGYRLVPTKPEHERLESMCLRFDHSHNFRMPSRRNLNLVLQEGETPQILMETDEEFERRRDYNRTIARQLYEEGVGEGFYQSPPIPEQEAPLTITGPEAPVSVTWTPEDEARLDAAIDKRNRAAIAKNPPTLRQAALSLYTPPFRFEHGYIFDSLGHMVADDDGVPEHVAQRIRGWGRIGYFPKAAALQDELGAAVVEALNEFWAKPVTG